MASPVRTPSSGRKHRVQLDVEDFHYALDVPIGVWPAIRRPGLRAALIAEEARETLEAITGEAWRVDMVPRVLTPPGDVYEKPEQDLVAAIDGMCDLLCVVYGTAVEFGIDLAPFWEEVHRTNMAKRGGPVREDGKRLKPDGWEPPNLRGVLQEILQEMTGGR